MRRWFVYDDNNSMYLISDAEIEPGDLFTYVTKSEKYLHKDWSQYLIAFHGAIKRRVVWCYVKDKKFVAIQI